MQTLNFQLDDMTHEEIKNCFFFFYPFCVEKRKPEHSFPFQPQHHPAPSGLHGNMTGTQI